jgi:hemolysin III
MKIEIRDFWSAMTHLLGAFLSVIGTIIFIVNTVSPFRPWHFATLLTFGIGLILLYSASTVYHWAKISEEGIKQLKRIDHIMIFVLIAASYTPISLLAMRDNWGWPLFIAAWSIALAGVFIKIFWLDAPRWFSTTLYLAMGWLVVIAIYPLIQSTPAGALYWITVGGIFYTVGGVIYGIKKPDPFPGVFGFHEIFHLFVLMGSASHWWAMYRYLLYY